VITIREFADPADREALIGCVIALQEHERMLDPSMPEGTSMAGDYLAFLLTRCRERQGRILLANVNGQVAGFVCVLAAMPPSEPDEPRQTYAYISDLFVHAGYRGKGIGRKLLQHAEEFARAGGAAVLQIGVLAANRSARRLYESCGFTEYHIQLAKTI
jgi:ribosomal protein S18 acetylase RimI-like enzyme